MKRIPASRLLLVVGVCLLPSTAVAGAQTVDFSEMMTDRCDLEGLVAVPPEGWFNVPFQDPPAGHLGCQMMRTNDNEELVGIIRVRSVTTEAPEYGPQSLPEGGGPFEAYAGLLNAESIVLTNMGYQLGDDPLWRRNDVPIAGPGFSDGRAIGIAASIEGNDYPQEAHFLVFRGENARYIFTLTTPAASRTPDVYQVNIDSFGTVIRTLQPRQE